MSEISFHIIVMRQCGHMTSLNSIFNSMCVMQLLMKHVQCRRSEGDITVERDIAFSKYMFYASQKI